MVKRIKLETGEELIIECDSEYTIKFSFGAMAPHGSTPQLFSILLPTGWLPEIDKQ